MKLLKAFLPKKKEQRSNIPLEALRKIPQLNNGPDLCVLDKTLTVGDLAIETEKHKGAGALYCSQGTEVVIVNYDKESKQYLISIAWNETLAASVWVGKYKLADETRGDVSLEEAMLSPNESLRNMARDVHKALSG